MPMHLMIAVDWFGPYDLDQAWEAAKSDCAQALYICLGRQPYERARKLQYIGIGNSVHTRLKEDHHKLQKVTRERQIWLGEIATAEPSGKKLKVTKATLNYAEWLHARFLQLPLNEKKTKALPLRSVTLMNRWFRPDFATPRKNRPHPGWPGVIDYLGYDLPARMVWFGGRQQYFLAP